MGGGYRELENASFSLNARRLEGARIRVSKAGRTLCLYDVLPRTVEEPATPTLEPTPTTQATTQAENDASITLILVLLLIGIAVLAYGFATKKIRA